MLPMLSSRTDDLAKKRGGGVSTPFVGPDPFRGLGDNCFEMRRGGGAGRSKHWKQKDGRGKLRRFLGITTAREPKSCWCKNMLYVLRRTLG